MPDTLMPRRCVLTQGEQQRHHCVSLLPAFTLSDCGTGKVFRRTSTQMALLRSLLPHGRMRLYHRWTLLLPVGPTRSTLAERVQWHSHPLLVDIAYWYGGSRSLHTVHELLRHCATDMRHDNRFSWSDSGRFRSNNEHSPRCVRGDSPGENPQCRHRGGHTTAWEQIRSSG